MIGRASPMIVAGVFFALSGYVVQVFLGRELGPAAYGLVGVAISVLTLANAVQASGMPQAVTRRVAAFPDDSIVTLAMGVRLQAVVSVFLMACVAAIALVLRSTSSNDALITYLLVGALMLPGFGWMQAHMGFWSGKGRFRRVAAVQAAYALSKIVFIIGLAWTFGPIGAVAGYCIAPLAGVALGFTRFPMRLRGAGVALLINAGWTTAFALIVLAIYSVGLYLVSASATAPPQVGHYVAAQTVAAAPLFVATSMGRVLLPSVARSATVGDWDAAAVQAVNAVRQLGLVLLPAAAVMSATADRALSLFFGTAYAAGGSALQVLMFALAAIGGVTVLGLALIGMDDSRGAVVTAAVGLATTTSAGIPLVSWFSTQGAAVAVLLGAGTSVLLACVRLRRVAPVVWRPRPWLAIVAGAVSAFAVASVPLAGVWLPVLWVVGGAVGLWVAFTLGGATPEEQLRIRSIVGRVGRAGES